MSQLLTAQAMTQAGANLTHLGNLAVPAASTIGLASGANGVVITFDSTNSAVAIGDTSNNSYLMMYTDSGDTSILDSNAKALLDFDSTGSAVNYINIINQATGVGPMLSAQGSDTNIDLDLDGQATGQVTFGKGNTNTPGIAIYAGSSADKKYTIKPASGVSGDIGWNLPASNGTANQVLAISSVSGSDLTLGWADDSSGSSLSWAGQPNTTTSGTNTESPSSANVGISFAGTMTTGTRVVSLSGVSSPSVGDRIMICDSSGQGSTYNITVTGQTINGTSGYTMDSNYQVLEIAYMNSSVGWTII